MLLAYFYGKILVTISVYYTVNFTVWYDVTWRSLKINVVLDPVDLHGQTVEWQVQKDRRVSTWWENFMFWRTVPLRGTESFVLVQDMKIWKPSLIPKQNSHSWYQIIEATVMLCFASIHKLCSVSSVHRAEEIRPSQEAWRLGPIDMHSPAPPHASKAPSICQSAPDSLQTDR